MGGQRVCEHCGKSFEKRYFLAIKLGFKRLERCPHCHRFTDVYKVRPAPEKEARPQPLLTEEEVLRRRVEESKGEELQ